MIGNITKGKSFGGTVKYVLGKQGAQLIYTNVFAGLGSEVEPSAIAAEMTATASRNCTIQPVYHLSISPAQPDRLSITDWVNFSQALLKELGLEKNQVVVALHHDEDYPNGQPRPHAHLVVNLVDDAGRRANTSWDYYRTERALRHLERCYDLTQLQSSWEVQAQRIKTKQLESESFSSTTATDSRQSVPLATSRKFCELPQLEKARVKGIETNQQESQIEQSVQELAMTQSGSDQQPQIIDSESSSYKKWSEISAAVRRQDNQQFANSSNRQNSRLGKAVGNELEHLGQFLQRSGDQEIDGMQLAGAGLSLLGSGVKIADAIAEALARAREGAEQDRLNGIINDLEAVGKRAENLEQKLRTSTSHQQQVHELLETTPENAVTEVNPNRLNKVIRNLEAVEERAQMVESSLVQPVSEFLVADPWVEANSEVKPDLALITDKLQNAKDLKELQQIKEEYGKQTTTAAWNGLPQSEQDRLTELTQFQSGAQLETDLLEIESGEQQKTALAFSETENGEHPLADAAELLDEQITRLEEQFDGSPDTEFVPIKIDREASLDKQLDQIEAAIDNLNSRLDKLEEAVRALQVQRETVSEVAESLVAHAKARAEVYGTSFEDPIPTKTMGTIEVSDQGNYVAILGKDYEPRFEAIKLNNKWEVTNNKLSPDETERLINIPKDTQTYRTHVDGRDLVNYLQRNLPDQFNPNKQGTILWQDKENKFGYEFTISETAEGLRVKGIDKNNQGEVFSATIQADKTIKTSQSEIPTERISDLMREERQQQKTATKVQEQELTQ